MPERAHQINRMRDLLGPDRVRQDVLLAPYTTFRIGGPADFCVEARSAQELEQVIITARELEIPFFLLGLGANILMSDAGFRGLVVRNLATKVSVDQKNEKLRAESGAVVSPDVIDTAIAAGLSGFEHFAGIPSTIGGALWQNLHFLSPAPERERTIYIEEILENARILRKDNSVEVVQPDFFEFGYDQSILQRGSDIVLEATFQLAEQEPHVLHTIVTTNLEWRGARHPPLETEPSAGSIFKKIEGIGAGRLIDQCGLKGASIGGAAISEKHANFIINRSFASADDVLRLIALVQETVERETGYRLETEINLVGGNE